MRPEMMLCCICERPAGCIASFVPLCLRCRTAGYERVAAVEERPVMVLSNLTGSDLLIQNSRLRSASGAPGSPLEAA
jgi:hypothetical protein